MSIEREPTITARIIPELTTGTELEVVNAARKSFNAKHRVFEPSDARLLKFLIKEKHWLPFRHPQLSFECEAPVFVARQLGKHQVGMSWSEVSRRYKTEGIKFWMPDDWRTRPAENIKQGTGVPLHSRHQFVIDAAVEAHIKTTLELYWDLLDRGVAPEQARAILPQSMIVGWTWTGSLLAWIHLVQERTHPNAQYEARQFAEIIRTELEDRFPLVAETLFTTKKELPEG